MPPTLRAWTTVIALFALASPRLSLACGASPTPSMTLLETRPTDGATGVALDAPVLVYGTAWPSAPADLAGPALSQGLQVEVRARGKTALIEGELHPFFGPAAWVPAKPLDPSTIYDFKLHVANQAPLPAGATGPTDLQFSLTTGGSLLAPLTLSSEPGYAFATRELHYCPPENQNDCGGCSVQLTRPGKVAVVTPPTIEGGAPEGGVWITAWLESGQGVPEGTVKLGNSLLPGQPVAPIEIPVPTEVSPYESCLHVEVTDATGVTVKSATRCFPAGDTGAGNGGQAGASSAGAAGSPGAPSDPGAGCSTGGQKAQGGWLTLALAALALRRQKKLSGSKMA